MTMHLFWGEEAKGVPLLQDYFKDPKQIVMGQSMWLLPIIILVNNKKFVATHEL